MFEDVPGFIALLGANFGSVGDCQECRYDWSPAHPECGQFPSVTLRTRHTFDLYGPRDNPVATW